MTRSLRRAFAFLTASVAVAAIATSAPASPRQHADRIEVAFVLDTTGSMTDLIDGAKRKIWSIANTIVDVNPDADIRMALIGYRDVGDEYVIKSYGMSDDIQGLYGNLIRFVADGGGDTPESVNEALHAAVNDLQWSDDDNVRRIIFLVGDAPPHMDYDNGPKYQRTIKQARKADIIVNTVQAGADPETTEYWREMAQLGEGRYFAIPQDGGQVQVYNSPYDDKIIELQQRIDKTVLPYGSRQEQDELRAKMDTRAAAPAAVQVDNSKFYAKRSAKELVTGGGDLLDDVRNKVRNVEDIKDDELPAELKGKSAAEIKQVVADRTAEREKLEADMAGLVRQRDDYVAAEMKKQPADASDSFDKQVSSAIAAQF